ncbi:MAG: carotenoid biosynthesis protein [Candidatus Cryosericum sp.]
MGTFTFIPTWIVQDIIVYLFAIITVVFIIRHEKQAASVILEFVCFVLLYAAVFENFATLMDWYGYGRSVLMIFNVPASVPVMEYLVVYSGLRLADAMRIPTWCKPIFVGVMGILTDFSLDPLAVSQRFTTREGVIGRWTWYIGGSDIQIHAIPVYNFTGWFLLCGYAAVFLLLGRWWHRKTGYNATVGMVYPPLALLLSLGVLVSPLSSFLLWLAPFFTKGGVTEVIMLCSAFALFIAVMIIWRGRMTTALSLRGDYPILMIFVGLHVCNLLFAVIGGYWDILPITVPFATLHIFLVSFIFRRGCKVKQR